MYRIIQKHVGWFEKYIGAYALHQPENPLFPVVKKVSYSVILTMPEPGHIFRLFFYVTYVVRSVFHRLHQSF